MFHNVSLPLVGAATCLVATTFCASSFSQSSASTLDETRGLPAGVRASDWSAIQASVVDGFHAVTRDARGHRAQHVAARYTTQFDGRGFEVASANGHVFGLELERFGAGSADLVAGAPFDVRADGTRLEYVRAGLVEWFDNGRGGLEHGLTLDARPAGAADTLSFVFDVRGDLAPRVAANGRDVALLDAHGAVQLSYDGLVVFDRDGDRFPAHFDVAAGDLVLTVHDAGADYPLTIDPTVHSAYVKASNTDPEDFFTWSIGVDGDTLIVGAWGEGSAATGVDGDGSTNGTGNAGAAYVFVKSGPTWVQQAFLKASNTGTEDRFGWSVAVSGDIAVVGALQEDSSSSGVNGAQNRGSSNSGAAYVFVRNAGVWSQQAFLKASNNDAGDQFGVGLAVSGETIVVGADGEDSDAVGVNGNQASNAAQDSGAVYVFVRTGGVWSQQAYLKAANTNPGDAFGRCVALDGDTLIVGAPLEDSNATGINGNRANNGALDSGAAYVFTRTAAVWSQQAYLKASNTGGGDEFGCDVDIDGDRAIIGAPREDSASTGVNGDGANDGATDSGAAYVFTRVANVWSQEAYLKASNPDNDDHFGQGVAISGNQAIVGAPDEDSASTGIDGDQSDDSLIFAGAAYLFEFDAGAWSQESYIKASNTGIGDRFGYSVAIDGDVVFIGAPIEASWATGINGDQADNNAGGAGAGYVVDITEPVIPPDPKSVGPCYPGSVLVYPIIRSSLLEPSVFNVVNVTNTARAGDCTTDIHFEYVNVSPSPTPFLFAQCTIDDRVETLTPADTLSVLTSCHNSAAIGNGYLVVSAMDPNELDTYWAFNHLIGSEHIISIGGGIYAIAARPFQACVPDKTNTDLDADGKRDFDGKEYNEIPDELYIDSFIGQLPGDLVLISFTGPEYLTQVKFIIYNDDEFQLSGTFQFACWTRTPLSAISGYFTAGGLSTTPDDNRELDLDCDGLEDFNTGWAIVRAQHALSISSPKITDPAILGALANDNAPFMNARWLWSSVAKQANGSFPP
jgi:hypothetical protein